MTTFLDDDDVCFVFEEEDVKQSGSQLQHVAINEAFIFQGKRFTKINDYGWALGICNIKSSKGDMSYIHPTTPISLIH